LPFNENKELPTFIQCGPSSEQLSNYWHGENECAIGLFIYLLRKSISYTKFVEAGEAKSVYRLGFGPHGFGFESLYRQEVFPSFKTRIPSLESTYTPM
jgi:hypothetical protein